MSRLEWDKIGERRYQTGIYNCALYVESENKYNGSTIWSNYQAGVPWNGVSGITEKPSGAEATAVYADNIKYLNLISKEDFKASIEAYTYPDEFEQCDGIRSDANTNGFRVWGQTRKKFGLAFKTNMGSDTVDANDPNAPYILHLLYNCRASVSERAYKTINNSPEAMTFSWDLDTDEDEYIKLVNSSYNSAVHFQIRSDIERSRGTSTSIERTYIDRLEAVLFGTDEYDSTKSYAYKSIVAHTTGTGASAVTSIYANTTQGAPITGTWDATKWTLVCSDATKLVPSNVVYNILRYGTATAPAVNQVANKSKKSIKSQEE